MTVFHAGILPGLTEIIESIMTASKLLNESRAGGFLRSRGCHLHAIGIVGLASIESIESGESHLC